MARATAPTTAAADERRGGGEDRDRATGDVAPLRARARRWTEAGCWRCGNREPKSFEPPDLVAELAVEQIDLYLDVRPLRPARRTARRHPHRCRQPCDSTKRLASRVTVECAPLRELHDQPGDAGPVADHRGAASCGRRKCELRRRGRSRGATRSTRTAVCPRTRHSCRTNRPWLLHLRSRGLVFAATAPWHHGRMKSQVEGNDRGRGGRT